jgi:hypothetical protein
MKFSELRTPSGRPLPLHPRLAVIEANAEIRSQVLTALRNAMRPGGSAAGYVEVHGVLLDFDRETLRVLDLDPAPELVLDAASIPIEAYGSAGRRPPIVDDVATNHRDLVDARRHEVQVALDVVAIMQAALRAATDERDRAAGAFAAASGELADAIASRDSAYRAVESLADAVQDDPDDDIVEAELVVEEPPDVDPWAEQRVTRLDAVDAAERRVLEARAEVEQSARAANPARLDQQDRAALEAAHDAVLDADERAGRRLGGASARKRLDEARAAERVVLDRLGLDSYSDFLLRSSMGATDPSAELRLEIARTELMEAERALTVARVASEAVPDPLPSEPAVLAAPEAVAAPAVPKASPPAELGEGAARLAAATRARDDAIAAEQRAHATYNEVAAALADAEAKLLEVSVRHDEAEQTLVQARVRLDAALAEVSASNGHPSDPAWGDGDTAGAVSNEIDSHLLAWLAARGQHPLADPLPIVLDDAYRELGNEDLDALLTRLDHLADSLHVVYLTDDARVLQWAAALPPDRAGLTPLPAAGSTTPA